MADFTNEQKADCRKEHIHHTIVKIQPVTKSHQKREHHFRSGTNTFVFFKPHNIDMPICCSFTPSHKDPQKSKQSQKQNLRSAFYQIQYDQYDINIQQYHNNSLSVLPNNQKLDLQKENKYLSLIFLFTD